MTHPQYIASPQARGLKPAQELGADKPHGTRVKYRSGCRCTDCRRANTAYQIDRYRARAEGDTRDLVSAEPARRHMLALSASGVGCKTIADAACINLNVARLIFTGRRQQVRQHTERAILAVTTAAAADGAYISAKPSWELLDELLACGYSRAHLVREILGPQARALQFSRGQISVRNADRIRRAYDRLRLADPKGTARAQQQLRELRAEGYLPGRIDAEFSALASRRHPDAPPTLDLLRGRMLARSAVLVDELHQVLTHADLTA